MRAGKLRHRIQIRSRVEDVRDAHGGVIEDWATLDTVPGSVEPLQGRELFEAQQTKARVTLRIRLRYFEGLTAAHQLRRITQDSDGNVTVHATYGITTVIEPETRGRELEVLCVEAV